MKAIVFTEYGSLDVLELQELANPAPHDDEVLIQVRAASVNHGDRHTLRGDPFLLHLTNGLRRPKHTRLGADVAGRVEAVGRTVTRFRPGDEVYGDLSERGRGVQPPAVKTCNLQSARPVTFCPATGRRPERHSERVVHSSRQASRKVVAATGSNCTMPHLGLFFLGSAQPKHQAFFTCQQTSVLGVFVSVSPIKEERYV